MLAPRSAGLPRHEAERLLAAVTGRERRALLDHPALSPIERARLDELTARRLAGEPLQYLEGTVQFGPLELSIDPRALIPRPETERLWELAVECLGEAGAGTVIVDLCTGSGNLALALKHAFPAARVYGTDSSPPALELAAANAARTGLEVTFLEGDLYDALPPSLMGRIDLLVTNPPYVAESDFAGLPPDVRDHEPSGALVAGPAGDEVLAAIAADAYWWLGVGGWMLAEIGETQGERALELFGALDRRVEPDLAGKDRFLIGRRGASCCR